MFINEQSKMNLNGVPQFVSIRGEKKEAPLLVYLHGGPGDAALPLVMKYNKMLEQQFTVVVWEQRGAGKSYYKFIGPVTIDDFLNDLHVLVNYLLSRFQQNSLYLIGHSWGSILGLRFVEAYPELVRTYIGCGQVVNMRQSSKTAYEYALAHADKKSLEKLRGIDCSYQTDSWLNDLLFVTRQVVRHKGSLYGRTNYNDLVIPFLFSPYYTLPDLIRRQKGSLQAIQYLWQEVMQTDFEEQTHYGAPLIFIEGRYDSHVSSALVKKYFDRIETEKQFYWFENSCHFPQWSESERFNKLLCDLLA
ncbi:alpha/beta fold hydrolase [Lactonifactor sp. BIOML-A3]|uniref:alpha/beta fold hydrolase n=1 Tax=unclassified Lactonifactor TaxID=2636670 RepID=UPI0012B15F1D|nr:MULTISPECIES: alpha/beta hydrolase [unclassified Lactonifactor]MSA03475.1 alpha/beta fold hydrolase [Lactonifactor sp. BIOML-A5]MSA10596.1 alpha/beta fold hydrolase [Lactonifactor sp. BIOML-A4]MSA15081.1 alpha/beta fold hydrolase [Lactonifactor sp. BIOML-A3]MSA17254.1 alpha/beta fold hydrolase [Lactonifactor sp. BIOML-A2]MSA40146.1 alpha/beta fold hydrolase [Lactonifactor sp. BIOML-A1]